MFRLKRLCTYSFKKSHGRRLRSVLKPQFKSYLSKNRSWFLSALALPVGIIATLSADCIKEKYSKTSLPIEFCEEAEAAFGDNIIVVGTILDDHSRDFSYHDPKLPDAVIYVDSIEDVQKAVTLCNKYKIPIVTFGSGTSLEGHIIPHKQGSVTLNMSRMNKVLEVHPDDFDVVVQPGISYSALNDYLKMYGFFFPLDPGPGASVGGMIGTSCSGTNAVRYGTAKDNVLSLLVVTADGKVIKTGTRAKKNSAGYDLTHLFIGSEGTLGVIVEATLKIHKIPTHKTTALCTFNSIESAAKAVIEMIHNSVRIGKVELLDETAIKAVNLNGGLSYDEKPTLIFEFSGSECEVNDTLQNTQHIISNYTTNPFIYAKTEEEKEELYRARKEALWAAPVLLDGSTVLITDVCVPISRMAQCLKETQEDVEKLDLIAPLVAHAGDGNFHLFVLFRKDNTNEVERVHILNDRLIKRAIAMDGTCTGEHGVGIGKREYIPMQIGDESVDLMKAIKKAMDPNSIFNPGKVLIEELE